MYLLCSDVQKATGCVLHRMSLQTKKEENIKLMWGKATQESGKGKGNSQDDGRRSSSIVASL